jgi:hypothetical protein
VTSPATANSLLPHDPLTLECCHGCGYIHLSNSTSSTKKKCCANGALYSLSHNFDEELKMRFGMEEMPLFMRLTTMRRKFCQDCTKYNNLFAMAATKVCNYCDNSGFTNQGPGHNCVTLSGRDHHFFTRVSISNPQVVVHHILFLTVWCHVHVRPNLEM